MFTAFIERSNGFTVNVKEIEQIEHLQTVRSRLREGELREAFTLLQKVVVDYPQNPFLLSYFGYLQAALEKRYRAGIENCRKAISLEERRSEADDVSAELYLNLARAYIAAGRRKPALDALEQGLRYDTKGEVVSELRSLGIRKKPPVPFLDRSNPINKYIGMMLRKG